MQPQQGSSMPPISSVHIVPVVDYRRPIQEILDAVGRIQNVEYEVVAAMSSGSTEVVANLPVVFFKFRQYFRGGLDLQREYESRGLKPDPWALAIFNKNNPTFADRNYNFTQWPDKNLWCIMSFYLGGNLCSNASGHRIVNVRRSYDGDEYPCYWLVGGTPDGIEFLEYYRSRA